MQSSGKNDWQSKKIGDLVSFTTGKLNSNAAKPNGAYPFFTCSRETFRTDTYSFDCECVLLAGNNAAGAYPLKYFKGRFDAYQRTYVIRSNDNRYLKNRFLFYALQPMLELLNPTTKVTKMHTIYCGLIRDFILYVVPITLSIVVGLKACLPE